jgi:predicted ester cyclase
MGALTAPGQRSLLRSVVRTLEVVACLRSITRTFSMRFSAFPDFRMDLEDTLVDGDKVCLRYRMTGTNTVDFLGILATGKR